MESGSDWDSLSGDDDIEPPSISIAADTPQNTKHVEADAPHVAPRGFSPSNKNPLTRTGMEPRAPPRTAETYRNMLNKGNVQGITAFKDRGDYDATSERSTPTRSRRDVQTPNEQSAFKEIELKENKTALNRAPMSSSSHQKKKSVFRDSNENLPYTEFEANDMSPVRLKGEPLAQTAVPSRAHQEYIVPSPAPQEFTEPPPRKSIKKQERNVQESKGPKGTKTKDKKSHRAVQSDDDDILVNEHVSNKMSYESDVEPDSDYHHSFAKNGPKDYSSDAVILKNYYDKDRLEERFLYEDGIRDYCSAYTGSSAKMPIVADRIETYTKRGIQEVFGTLQILVDFVVIFVVELARFLFKQFGRKLLGGVIIVFGDSFLKPLLAVSFNNIIQPLFILVWNMMHVFRKLIEPALLLTREIFSQLAMLLRSLRLVDWFASSKESPVVKNV